MNRNINFSAGPAALPLEVLQECNDEWFNWKKQGASICEVSHRCGDFKKLFPSIC